MDHLTYTLRVLCHRNRDGSYATQADRQRTLMQQQSAIDPTARTRLTTCRYDDVVLHCTTS